MHLVAVGTNEQSRLELEEGIPQRLGRAPRSGWAIHWDQQISREHADVVVSGGKLRVTCTENASNPILFGGRFLRSVELPVGGTFKIGQTEFRFVAESERPSEDPAAPARSYAATVQIGDSVELLDSGVRGVPVGLGADAAVQLVTDEAVGEVEEYSFGASDLQKVGFVDPSRQMELLSGLPQLIASTTNDVELALKLAGLLLEALPQAVAVAVVQYDEAVVDDLRRSQSDTFDLPRPKTMRVQTRDDYDGRFVPSRRLLCKSLRLGESTMHIWAGGSGGGQFTMSDSLSWAFCTPVSSAACLGWCLYVSGAGGKDGGQFVTEDDLKGDLRFTELLAQFIASIRQVRVLQEHTTQLSSFFSPTVVQSLTGKSSEDALKPSERDITVMFCDVRGFSKKAEKYRDSLSELLECVRAALGAMTGGILQFDGTIADFQGDAALGFWGWPVALAEGPIPACLAALAVQAEFNKPAGQQGMLEGFSVGVGIAHGRAIAGQIGTSQQAKVGVFGPVVNQGSRLEGMTKQFGVSICIDEATAEFVRRMLPRDQARTRRLARVRPKGMDVAMTVSELLPPAAASSVTEQVIEQHEAAVELILAGHWTDALQILRQLPDSGPKQFLLDRMRESNHQPPDGWEGAFALTQK